MKNNRRVIEDRHQKLLRLIGDRKEMKNDELAEALGVSLMTVRRDLELLENQNLLCRTHGGAVSMEKAHLTRTIPEEDAHCRKVISAFASRYLEDGDRIFMNGSRLALNMLEYAGDKRIRVYTNNGWAIGKNYPQGVSVFFTGGEMLGHLMVGEGVIRNLLSMKADKTFLGCAAVYESGEFRYDIWTETAINEMMVTRTSGPLYLLAEHSKLHRKTVSDRTGSGVIYDRPVTLITDSGADPAICESLRKKGIEVVLAEISYTEM